MSVIHIPNIYVEGPLSIDTESSSSPATLTSAESSPGLDSVHSYEGVDKKSKIYFNASDTSNNPQKLAEAGKETKRSLVADTKRLWNEIHHTAQWGAIPNSTGMARLTLSDEDKKVRDYFIQEAHNIGCDVKIDQMGNIFAILPGENNIIPPIGMGSHLDTQPAGGRYDGILGVLSALEVLRTVKNSGKKTFAPLAAINWTNEEGARFTPGCSGSAVWAEHMPLSKFHNLDDSTKTCTMKGELNRIGYLGDLESSHRFNKLSAHVELHIEQRCVLQDTKRKIGIVTAIQGIRWYQISIIGTRAHAGATPMAQRADALVAAAAVILFVNDRAREISAVATVGVLELDRPSSNTVPGVARFSLDLRHPSESVLDEFESSLRSRIDGLTTETAKFNTTVQRIWHSPAVEMNRTITSCIESAAHNVVGEDRAMDMISLAGHDSALTAIRVPTGMIFVPSKDGISHAPEEFTSEEECGLGLQVLLESVLGIDSVLRSQDKY